MNNTKRLATQVAGAVAIATLIGTSAFAESRPLNTTDDSRSKQTFARRDDHGSSRSSERHDTRSTTRSDRRDQGHSQAPVYRNTDRGRSQSNVYRNTDRNIDRSRSQSDVYRNGDRGRVQSEAYRSSSNWRSQSDSFRSGGNERSRNFDNRGSRATFDSRGRESMSINGRINRFSHERGGYRVWLDGGRFPFFIPEARLGLFPHLRVGLSLRVGGYYDPLGYLEAYDYYGGDYYGGAGAYDVGSYDIGTYGAGTNTSGVLRGVVETIDDRRGTMVLRDDASGNFVTAIIRDRRLESLRPGDFAEISGDWTRGGVFEALRLEDVDGGRY